MKHVASRFVIIPAIAFAWLLALANPAQAGAHCLCRIATDQGPSVFSLNNYIYDFGTVGAYGGAFAQLTDQGRCASDCQKAANPWYNNLGDVCDGFYESNAATLVLYDKLGTRWWTDIGATQASAVGYPQSCYGPSGVAHPSYYILTLLYAPPGCTKTPSYNCAPASQVKYSDGSTTGTTTTISQSYKAGTTLMAGPPIGQDGISASLGYAQTNTVGATATIQKLQSYELDFPANGSPPVSGDGIDHDADLFVLLVDPPITISGWTDPITGLVHLEWVLSSAGAEPQEVQVSNLRCALAGVGPGPGGPYNHALYDSDNSCEANPILQMPGPPNASGPTGFLPGVTNADYVQMLAQDPFQNASPSNPVPIPQPRFTQQLYNIPYDPPKGTSTANTYCVTDQLISNTQNTDTSSSSVVSDYLATLSISATIPDFGKLVSNNTLEWTDTTSTSNTDTNSQTATLVLGCASPNWQGPFDLRVDYDNLFGVFLLSVDDHTGEVSILKGHISDKVTGVPIYGVPVDLTQQQVVVGRRPPEVIYHTFTDNQGNYAFYRPGDRPPGIPLATLSVGGTSRPVVIGPTAAAVDVAIPQPAPVLLVEETSRPVGSANLSMTVTNLSGVMPATGVTVTGITGITATGATFVYQPNLEVIPFVIPGAANLGPNATAGFNLDFVTTAGSPGGPFSFVITVKAQNVPEFATKINIP